MLRWALSAAERTEERCRTGSHIGNKDVDEKMKNGKEDKEQEHDHHTLRCDSLFGLRVCWWLCRGSAVGTTPRVIGHFTPALRTRLPQHASLSLRCPGTAGRHPAPGLHATPRTARTTRVEIELRGYTVEQRSGSYSVSSATTLSQPKSRVRLPVLSSTPDSCP